MLKRNENRGKDWKRRGEYDIMSPDMISCSIGNTMLQESTKVMLPIEQKPLRGMRTLFCRMAYRAGRRVKEKKNRRHGRAGGMEMAEMRTLENAYLVVEVSDAGAELSRVYDKKKEREVLWNADAKYWGRHVADSVSFCR